VNIDPTVAHTLEKRTFHTPASHVIIDHPHLYTLAGLVDERIGNEVAQLVIIEDIDVDMDVVAGTADGSQQREKTGMAVGEDVHLVVFERQRHVLVPEKQHQRLVALGQSQLLLLEKLGHRSLGQLVKRALTDQFLPAGILSEEDIEDESDDRQKPKHENPSRGLGRLPIVHQHPDHHRDDHKSIDDSPNRLQVNHGLNA